MNIHTAALTVFLKHFNDIFRTVVAQHKVPTGFSYIKDSCSFRGLKYISTL